MENIQFTTQSYFFNQHAIDVIVPNEEDLKKWQLNTAVDFPFWAKVWPASLAILLLIEEQHSLVKNKTVVEIAAGIGLPSLACSSLASNVVFTDYSAEALKWFYAQPLLKKSFNITAQLYNWNQPCTIDADVYMLSDVNYNELHFAALHSLIENLLLQHKTIILSTPERIVAKNFIQPFLAFTRLHKRYFINNTACSVLLLTNN